MARGSDREPPAGVAARPCRVEGNAHADEARCFPVAAANDSDHRGRSADSDAELDPHHATKRRTETPRRRRTRRDRELMLLLQCAPQKARWVRCCKVFTATSPRLTEARPAALAKA